MLFSLQSGDRTSRRRAFPILRVVLALILIIAAALKATALWSNPAAEGSHLLAPYQQVIVVEWETIVGLWLLSGRTPRAAWAAGLATFGLLGSVSLFLVFAGQSSCDCFGRIAIHPWYAFVLDVGCCTALALCRPGAAPGRLNAPVSGGSLGLGKLMLLSLAGAAFLGGGVALFAVAEYGSVYAFLSLLRGERLLVDRASYDLGLRPLGTEETVSVRVRNRTERDVRIVGDRASCSRCVVTTGLPLTVGKNQDTELRIQTGLLQSSSFSGRLRLRLYTGGVG